MDPEWRERAAHHAGQRLFRGLFVADDAAGRKRIAESNEVNGSILDAVRGEAASLEQGLGKLDRQNSTSI